MIISIERAREPLARRASDSPAKGASGREIALRFNRSLIGLGLVTLAAVVFLLP